MTGGISFNAASTNGTSYLDKLRQDIAGDVQQNQQAHTALQNELEHAKPDPNKLDLLRQYQTQLTQDLQNHASVDSPTIKNLTKQIKQLFDQITAPFKAILRSTQQIRNISNDLKGDEANLNKAQGGNRSQIQPRLSVESMG